MAAASPIPKGLTPTPKPRTLTPQKLREDRERQLLVAESGNKMSDFSPRLVQSAKALQMLKDDLALALAPEPIAPAKVQPAETPEKKVIPSRKSSPKYFESPMTAAARTRIPTPKVESQQKKYFTTPGKTPTRSNSKYANTPSRYMAATLPKKTPESTSKPPASAKFKTPVRPTGCRSGFFPGSAGGGKKTPSYLRPTSASKHRASPRKDIR